MTNIMKKSVSVLMVFAMVFSLIVISPVSTIADEESERDVSEEVIAESLIDEGTDYKEGEAIVLFKNSGIASYSSISSLDKSLGSDITVEDTYMFGSDADTLSEFNREDNDDDDAYVVAVVSSDDLSTEQLVETLDDKSYISIVEPNYICKATNIDSLTVNNAAYRDYQWGLDTIDTSAAYEDLGTTGTDYVVAVLDTGIDYTNIDLYDNIWVNPYPSVLQGKYGLDFTGEIADGTPYDNNGHGTHVSGIIAGEGNNISGVAQQAKIMSLKFLGEDGSGNIGDAIAAYYYIYQALNLGVNVVAVNNSWGMGEEVGSIFTNIVNKVGEKGAITVFSANNYGVEVDGEMFTDAFIMESPYVVSVTAVTQEGELVSFSNYSADNIDLAAPGADILSTVSYNCFNPTIYSAEQISQLCADYNGYEDEDALEGAFVADSTVVADIGNTYGVEIADGGFAGSAKSLKLTADAKEGDMLIFAVPYIVGNSSTSQEVSYMLRTDTPVSREIIWYDDDYYDYESSAMLIYDVPAGEIDSYDNYLVNGLYISGNDNYWRHIELDVGRYAKEQTRYMLFEIWCEADGEYSIYLDDFAVSAQNKEIDADFGQYNYYSGTSMAAPFVTGAIALLSSQYTESELSEKVIERVNEIKSSVLLSDDLTDKCIMGGILNLNSKASGVPYIGSASLNNGTLTITGFNYAETPTVSITGSDGETVDAEIASSTDKEIVINGMSDYNFQKIVITVGSNGNASSKTVYLSDAEGYLSEGECLVLSESFTKAATDGRSVYLYDEYYESFYMYTPASDDYDWDDEDYWYDWSDYEDDSGIYMSYLSVPDAATLFPDATAYNEVLEITSEMVCANDEIYAIASLSSYSQWGVLYMTEYSIIKYTISTDTWSVVCKLPDTVGSIEKYGLTHYGQTLAAYNGYLYLVGGYSGQNATSDVVKYKISSGSWSEAASMPEARSGGICIQTGDKLVYTLGDAVDGTDCPATLVFDGTEWSKSEAELTPFKASSSYGASVSLCKEGVLYTGMTCEGLGDTFIYNVSTDKYITTGYSFGRKADNFDVMAVAVGDTLYAFSTGDDYVVNMYSIPVNSGLVSVTSSDYKYGYISGANEEVLPGTKVTLKATPYSGSYLKTGTLKINGTTYSGKSKTIYITKNQKASATFLPYVTKITLNKTSATMYYGVKNTLQLKASKITPSKADTTVTWSSSNTKYATVSSSGKVTIKKAGIGKTVTITVKAADGSKKTAKCKIKILQPIKKLKLSCSSSVKAGKSVKVKATYSPVSNINKSLTWKSSNTKYATVSSSGKVTTKKAGKGHTVTITATSKDGKKVSAKVKIKIK